MRYIVDFTLGALGALYIVTELILEFIVEAAEISIKNVLDKC